MMLGRHARRSRWALLLACLATLGCGRQETAPDASSPTFVRQGQVVRVPEGSPLRQSLHVTQVTQTTIEQPFSAVGRLEADPAGGPMWFLARVPPADLALVFAGRTAHILVGANPTTQLSGRVVVVGTAPDPGSDDLPVRIRIDQSPGPIASGVAATADFTGEAHQALTVPAAALVADGSASSVYVEGAPWEFEPRSVRTGPRVGSQVEIASGLSAGDRILASGAHLLKR